VKRAKIASPPFLADREIEIRRRRFYENIVPVVGLGLLERGAIAIPLAQLDVTNRPDVADLVRVHRVESVAGDHEHVWWAAEYMRRVGDDQ
jgi:hypothetical protein